VNPLEAPMEFNRQNMDRVGEEMHQFAAELFPICRSITGEGLRQTLSKIQKRIELKTVEVASGTQVFDWTVPKEWNIRDAWVKNSAGNKFIDFHKSNLHVMNYSSPVRAKMPLSELRPHLFTIPGHPDWIPYRTSYYKQEWGFCLSHNQLLTLPDGEYEVCVDSTLADGQMTLAECYLPGQSSDEVLISCHACHPSLANDNLSGVVVATFLAQSLMGKTLRYSYRFLFNPGTIGAIAWLARNKEAAQRVRHGLVLTCIGDGGSFHYKKSRRGDAEIDRAAVHVLSHATRSAEILDFSPLGYDERQFCSPGFNLPVGCLMRSVWGTFPEYHTSADNLDFIKPAALAESLRVCAGIVNVLEKNKKYRSLNPHCEPELGRRNLYPAAGDASTSELSARLWVLNLSDGENSLLDMAERSKLPFQSISEAADVLEKSGLLSVCAEQGASGKAACVRGVS
jgi:aminopeptidase-like protein